MSHQRPLVLTLSCLGFLFCAGCKPAATGPFSAILALERWHRTDPAYDFSGTGLVTFHRDDRTPRWLDLNANCKGHVGAWADSPTRPPSYGEVKMKIADRKEVRFAEDGEGAGFEEEEGAQDWTAGERLEVTAAGGEAPGFSVSSVLPEKVVLTSHDLPSMAANQLRISRDETLELRWTPTSGDVLLLFLQFQLSNAVPKEVGLWCVFPGSPGEASVPPAVLGNLKPSVEGRGTNIYFGGASRQTLALEGVELNVLTFNNECARIQID